MDVFYSIVAFFGSGGVFMYPILFVFAFGVAIAAERYITLAMVTNKNRVVWEKVQPLLNEGQFDEARRMTSEDESTISSRMPATSTSIIAMPAQRATPGKRRSSS